jgi:hypothetical protein
MGLRFVKYCAICTHTYVERLDMDLEWDRPVRTRRGGASRLLGIKVYYDFDWEIVFGHDRAMFPGGRSLAALIVQDCPSAKRPAILLTDRQDLSPTIRQTETEYVAVVPIRDYLRNAGGDQASTYYARLSAKPLTLLPSLAEVSFSVDELEAFLDANLTSELVRSWIERSDNPGAKLERVLGSADAYAPMVASQLAGSDPSLREALVRELAQPGRSATLRAFLLAVTGVREGRIAATAALAERLAERIADTRSRLDEYGDLIRVATTTETELQAFLERNPWIVGLPYVSARGRVQVPRGVIDFVLERFDGFFDVVELKGPHDDVVVDRGSPNSDRPSSASQYSLSPALAQALAQAHHYRGLLERTGGLASEFGLPDTREPRILIVLGTGDAMSAPAKEVLRQLNLSLHRVEVIPYDVLGQRTAVVLRNIEQLWTSPAA